MKTHELKLHKRYYNAALCGAKPFEVRFNDRNYEVGDRLVLREFHDGEYTGNVMIKDVTYVLDDCLYLKEGYVVLGTRSPV